MMKNYECEKEDANISSGRVEKLTSAHTPHLGIHLHKILIEFVAQNRKRLKICNNQHHSVTKIIAQILDRIFCALLPVSEGTSVCVCVMNAMRCVFWVGILIHS